MFIDPSIPIEIYIYIFIDPFMLQRSDKFIEVIKNTLCVDPVIVHAKSVAI